MVEHPYKVVELVGAPASSHAEAIENVIARAGKSLHHLRRFEMVQMRGEIEQGRIQHYQAVLKVRFTLDEAEDARQIQSAGGRGAVARRRHGAASANRF